MLYVVGAADSVAITEMSLIRSVLYRVALLYRAFTDWPVQECCGKGRDTHL